MGHNFEGDHPSYTISEHLSNRSISDMRFLFNGDGLAEQEGGNHRGEMSDVDVNIDFPGNEEQRVTLYEFNAGPGYRQHKPFQTDAEREAEKEPIPIKETPLLIATQLIAAVLQEKYAIGDLAGLPFLEEAIDADYYGYDVKPFGGLRDLFLGIDRRGNIKNQLANDAYKAVIDIYHTLTSRNARIEELRILATQEVHEIITRFFINQGINPRTKDGTYIYPFLRQGILSDMATFCKLYPEIDEIHSDVFGLEQKINEGYSSDDPGSYRIAVKVPLTEEPIEFVPGILEESGGLENVTMGGESQSTAPSLTPIKTVKGEKGASKLIKDVVMNGIGLIGILIVVLGRAGGHHQFGTIIDNGNGTATVSENGYQFTVPIELLNGHHTMAEIWMAIYNEDKTHIPFTDVNTFMNDTSKKPIDNLGQTVHEWIISTMQLFAEHGILGDSYEGATTLHRDSTTMYDAWSSYNYLESKGYIVIENGTPVFTPAFLELAQHDPELFQKAWQCFNYLPLNGKEVGDVLSAIQDELKQNHLHVTIPTVEQLRLIS